MIIIIYVILDILGLLNIIHLALPRSFPVTVTHTVYNVYCIRNNISPFTKYRYANELFGFLYSKLFARQSFSSFFQGQAN